MDIILTDSSIRKFLDTTADSDTLSQNLSLCGPTFDRVKKVEDDTVYEIEIITNRVDTASALGVAREAAAALTQFEIPSKILGDPYKEKPVFPTNLSKQFHFDIDAKLVRRFTAISLEKVSIKKSPDRTQKLLENCDQHALNNCIDVTNELTLLYGLPSHVFDLDKLAAQRLNLRESRAGEVVITLDGKSNELKGGDIVIEDGSGRLVDLCGVMGGAVAEVDDHTKNVLLIVPVYEPKRVRQTSLSQQKRTLAAQLYEKQPDTELCLPILAEGVKLLKERCGAQVSSSLFDFYPEPLPTKKIILSFSWLNKIVGVEMPRKSVITILANLGFIGTESDTELICTVPSWRYHDINIREDLAEEVARIYGYFRLPAIMPQVTLPFETQNPLLAVEIKAKKYLSHLGFHELFNNSLISLDLLAKTNQDPNQHLKLKNPLSSDFEYLRTTITPSLLENFKHNQGKVVGETLIYELANCYLPQKNQELPKESSTLAVVSSQDYLSLKGQVESLLKYLKVQDISFKAETIQSPFFKEGFTACVVSGDLILGQIGQVKPLVLRQLGLQCGVTALEINLEALVSHVTARLSYEPISEYPPIFEDLTLSSTLPIGEIITILKNTSDLIKDIRYQSSFKIKHTFSLTFGSSIKNLEQTEVNKIKDQIQNKFKSS